MRTNELLKAIAFLIAFWKINSYNQIEVDALLGVFGTDSPGKTFVVWLLVARPWFSFAVKVINLNLLPST